MTFSVPSFLAAATRLLIPPPAEAELTVAQLVPPLELVEESPTSTRPPAARGPTALLAQIDVPISRECLLLPAPP